MLDGLDECTLDQRKELSEFFLNIQPNTTSTGASQGIVKLFVTSRKEYDIERLFQQKSIQTIKVEASKVDSDIEVYVKAQVELRLQNLSTTLKNKIIRNLIEKASGMYVLR